MKTGSFAKLSAGTTGLRKWAGRYQAPQSGRFLRFEVRAAEATIMVQSTHAFGASLKQSLAAPSKKPRLAAPSKKNPPPGGAGL